MCGPTKQNRIMNTKMHTPEGGPRFARRQHPRGDSRGRLRRVVDHHPHRRRLIGRDRLRRHTPQTHRLTYLTRGSSTAYAISASSDPTTVATATTTVIPSKTG